MKNNKDGFFRKIALSMRSVFISDNPLEEPKMKVFWQKGGTRNLVSSLLAILFGLLSCLFVMLIMSAVSQNLPLKSAWKGFRILLGTLFYTDGSFGAINAKHVGDMLARATPLIMTGLSVAVAFKTGLFNIGAAGQYVMGIVGTLIISLSIDTAVVPAWIVWILAFLGGAALGFLWGCIPGIFKAFLNVNEVITCIMTNWISLHIAHWIFEVDYNAGALDALKAKFVNLTESTKSNFIYKTTHNGVSTPTLGLDRLFPNSQVDGGILIAIIIAIIMMILISKTTFGYELKATGHNRHASKYAGMSDKRNIVLAMGISGALAAMGAALFYMNSFHEYNWTVNTSLPAEGFNGIPVALLAYNNPIGAVFSSIFMAYINLAGEQVKGSVAINAYISDLIVAIVVYLSAFSLMFKDILAGKGLIFTALKTRTKKKTEGASAIEVAVETEHPVQTAGTEASNGQPPDDGNARKEEGIS